MKFSSQRNGLIKDVIRLFEDASWIAVLIAGVVSCQSVFGHVIW
jgi:hypothetical protein